MIDEKNLFSKSNLNFNESEMFAWKNKIEEEYKLYLIAQKKKREEKSELSLSLLFKIKSDRYRLIRLSFTGTAVSPSIPPRRLIITIFFLGFLIDP